MSDSQYAVIYDLHSHTTASDGVMFADMELIGIPHTIVLGDRNLDNDDIEYKYRRNGEKQLIKTGDIVEYLVKAIKG